MSETENIARMAELLSKEIFGVFGWDTSPGPRNESWDCPTGEHKDHPTDVVFWYDDPYLENRIYINSDVKSYATNSIKKQKIVSAIKSLSAAVSCANKSPEWQQRYVSSDCTKWQADGMLFLYNHDGEFSKSFDEMLGDLDEAEISIEKNRRIALFGPQEVKYLFSVAADISMMRGREELPNSKKCQFFYPDLIQHKRSYDICKAASLESLCSPWQIIKYQSKDENIGYEYVVFFRESGDEVDDFKYLIDFLFRYQILADPTRVRVRMPFADKEAPVLFRKAIEQYNHLLNGMGLERLSRITCEVVPVTISQFNTLEIGMRDE